MERRGKRRNESRSRLSEGEKEAGMIVSEGQREALLELQRTWVPCDGNHEWITDEEHPELKYCAKCMIIKEDD